MKHKNLFFCLFIFSVYFIASGQKYISTNEVCLFSFETRNGKKVMLVKEKDNKYVTYKFGSKEKIEFEFPEKSESSWKKFRYSEYHRGGGKQNDGMDLSHISFVNEDYKYWIYQEYHSETDKIEIGIVITNLKTGKQTEIKGKLKTKKGSLFYLKEADLFEQDDEI
jgi:hypothetical protein